MRGRLSIRVLMALAIALAILAVVRMWIPNKDAERSVRRRLMYGVQKQSEWLFYFRLEHDGQFPDESCFNGKAAESFYEGDLKSVVYYRPKGPVSVQPLYMVFFTAKDPASTRTVFCGNGYLPLCAEPTSTAAALMFLHSAIWWETNATGSLPAHLGAFSSDNPYAKYVSLKDAFDRPFWYAVEGQRYWLFSLGEDGRVSESDDVWSAEMEGFQPTNDVYALYQVSWYSAADKRSFYSLVENRGQPR